MRKPLRRVLITSAEAQPFRTQRRAPCSDCPWARKSLKGWLGPNTLDQWLTVARDYWHPIACHTRRIAPEAVTKDIARYSRRQTTLLAVNEACQGHWECAGGAIFRANMNVLPFSNRPWLILQPNKITVFASPIEFVNHHKEVK